MHGRPSRSVAICVLATRSALLPGVDVCLELRKPSLGVGLAYRLATRREATSLRELGLGR